MKFIKQISIEEVIYEWLQAEWYKSYYDSFRHKYGHIITDPNLTSEKENALRKDILFSVRHDVIAPLYHLNVIWYKVVLDKEDLSRLFVISASDWYTISGKTFALENVPRHVEENLVGHKASILKTLHDLKKGKKLNTNLILVGSDKNDLTIIEGNHRLSALMMFLEETKNISYKQEVTIGLTSEIQRYRWSIKWEKIKEFFQLCKDENASFNL